VGVVGAQVCQRHLRLGIVDGCCSTTSRVSDGDLQGCHCTADDVPFALFTTTDLSAAEFSQYSAMLNLARSKVTRSRHDLVMGNTNILRRGTRRQKYRVTRQIFYHLSAVVTTLESKQAIAELGCLCGLSWLNLDIQI